MRQVQGKMLAADIMIDTVQATLSQDKPNSTKERRKTGPKPEHVKIDKPWEKAISDALKKKRPPEGWPKAQKKNE